MRRRAGERLPVCKHPMNSPWQHYQSDLESGLIQADPAQSEIIQQLQVIFDDYLRWQRNKKSWVYKLKSVLLGKRYRGQAAVSGLFAGKGRLFAGKGGLFGGIGRLFAGVDMPRGLYLWGGVGIGKTYLMDIFFNTLPGTRKQRMHFHHFMREVHQQLHALQGQANPLSIIANRFAKETDILCFDEFMVHEIADAMLLGGLLEGLFQAGIVLVTTSNIAPEKLYENGLHRERFVPAIVLIQQHCKIIHCQTQMDYRLAHIKQHGVYFSPLTPDTQHEIEACFHELTSNMGELGKPIDINHRKITTLAVSPEVIWFDFHDICALGRSKNDYLEIAKEYHTVLISNLPKLRPAQTDKVTFFMHLVDILYDANVNLVIQADGELDEIYPEGPKAQEFKRTQSRLHEMQSDAYLHARHQ